MNHEDRKEVNFQVCNLFLDAPSHLYVRSCPSVGPSVRRSVGPVLFSKLKSTHTRRIFCRVSGLVFPFLQNGFASQKCNSPNLNRVEKKRKRKKKKKEGKKKRKEKKKNPPPKHITRDRIDSFNASHVKTENFSDQRTVVQKSKKYRKKKPLNHFLSHEPKRKRSEQASERANAAERATKTSRAEQASE